MQIGIDARLPYYQMGGISRYVLHLLPALSALDSKNNYTVFHSWKDEANYLPGAVNFERRNLLTPCHHRYERSLLTLELIPRRLDIFHSPDFIPPLLGARRQIITVHDLSFLYYPHYLTRESRRYYSGQIEWAVRRADHIAADSEYTRQDLLDRLGLPPEKVTTIPLAASPTFESPYTEEQIAETLSEFDLPRGFILFVGTLEPRKNVPTLLQAYAQLIAERVVDVPLLLVGGKGWLYDTIFETIQTLNLQQKVRHLSGVNDCQLAHLYHGAGLLALPSHYEGFGLPILEAMHCGCPVIASNRASLPEVVGQAGILLDPDDVAAWADALERLLVDTSLRASLVAAGRQQAQQFTWSKTAAATLKLYETQV